MEKSFVMPIKQQVPVKIVDPELTPEFQDALSLFAKRKVIEYLQ